MERNYDKLGFLFMLVCVCTLTACPPTTNDCKEGYQGDDCDECASGYQDNDQDGVCLLDCVTQNPACGQHEQCSDTDGTADCDCVSGYEREGENCQLIDPCADDTSCEAEHRECTNNQGTAECGDCLAGYHQEAESCVEDVDCGENTCNSHGVCDDSTGVPVCNCEDEYAGDHCENCAEGFQDYGDGLCRSSDPCTPNPCTDDYKTQCTNNQGSADCACDPDYELNDQDECIRYEYQCDSLLCGANLKRRSCEGDFCSPWEMLENCQEDQACLVTTQIHECQTCELGCLDGKCNSCALGSGPCCDEQGEFKPNTEACEQGLNYQCAGTGCGDDVQKQAWTKYCDGLSSGCESEAVLGSWEQEADCGLAALCQEQQGAVPICSLCEHGCDSGACLPCSSGACCDSSNHFEEEGTQCDEWTEYQCLETCGANRQYRIVAQKCTGDSANCDGDVTNPAWIPMSDCSPSHICTIDVGGVAQCSLCSGDEICVAGICACEYERCLDACCAEGEVCRWTETCGIEQMLTASDSQIEDQFGYSVSISGDMAIVGAWGEDGGDGDSMIDVGAAYIFQLDSGQWVEKTKLTAAVPRAGDHFGWSVSISGNVAIVGAPWEDGGDENPLSSSGAAYIFQLENGQWVEKTMLTASDAQDWDYFGYSVSISGDVAIVGATYEDGGETDPMNNVGAAYIIQLENGQWVEKQKLTASDPQANDTFAWSVSISGDVAIVGARLEDGGEGDPMSGAGAAYIYQLEDGQWVEKQKLNASDAQAYDQFGVSVSISGDRIIVGADQENGGEGTPITDAGAAYIFQLENGQWVEKKKLTASDAQTDDEFGNPVSISGDVAIVGATGEDGGDGNPLSDAGAAYIFQLENGQWVEKKKLSAYDAQDGDKFGWSVSTSGSLVIVGAPNEDGGDGDPISESGAAYIY